MTVPHAIRSVLVGHENSTLDDLSKIADSMLSITTSNLADPFSIAAGDSTNNMFDGETQKQLANGGQTTGISSNRK